jgi:peroxiredoxin
LAAPDTDPSSCFGSDVEDAYISLKRSALRFKYFQTKNGDKEMNDNSNFEAITVTKNYNILPPGLPVPIDDGGTDHLPGASIPEITLESTFGRRNLKETFKEKSVLFIYPRAGSPLEPNTNQDLWDKTPGARGCTPQSCGFRNVFKEFRNIGIRVYGLSVQSPQVQEEFAERNHIQFPILSDQSYLLTKALNLPTFEFEGHLLIKRMALYIEDNTIIKVFYPVFPPDKNAEEVLNWLRTK